MQFIRSKKLVFLNNKWWVGKTTISYNCAVKFAEKWYKTVIIDADPQCNISKIALWDAFDNSLFDEKDQNISTVLSSITKWWWDINLNVKLIDIRPNLQILKWSINLSNYQDGLISAYNQAAAWQEIWYFYTSAMYRYLNDYWLQNEIDIFIIDVSPSLDLFNRVILLGSDFFITPLMPDAFSLQWLENLWITLERRKQDRKNTWKALARWISNEKILNWEGLFIWYIINSYNQYGQKPIKSHDIWMKKIPEFVKEYLSLRNSKNWLVEKSRIKSLIDLKDFWQLSSDSQYTNKAIFELIPWKDFETKPWTIDNLEIAKLQFEELSENILQILHKY